MHNSFNYCPIRINNTSLRREKYDLSEYVEYIMTAITAVNGCANVQCATRRPLIYPYNRNMLTNCIIDEPNYGASFINICIYSYERDGINDLPE